MTVARQGRWDALNDSARTLWKAYRFESSDENRNKLVAHFLPLARYVAYHCWKKLKTDIQTDLDDLTSCASMALMDCVERFEPGRGVLFTTWAPMRLHGAALDHIRSMDWVPRLERKAQRKGKVNPVAMTSLEADRNFATSQTSNYNFDTTSFRDAVTDGRKSERVVNLNNREFFDEACKSLNQRDRMLVIAYYQDDLTMKEIGSALGLSESRVSQCHSDILRRLKKHWKQHGRPSDRQPQAGRRGARAHFGDVGVVRPAQNQDSESTGDQSSVPVCEVAAVRNPGRTADADAKQSRGVPPRKRRSVVKRLNRNTRRRGPDVPKRDARKQSAVRKKRSRPVVPGHKGAK